MIKENKYIRGDHWVISDLDGQKYRRSECVLVREPGNEINGLLVHRDEYAARHPQLDVRGFKERIAVKNARPRPPTVYKEGSDR